MRLRHVSMLGLALLAAPAAAQAPQPAVPPAPVPPVAASVPNQIPGAAAMASHRAAYRLTLDRARDNSDVAQAQGAMMFEVLDACEGWTTRQRLTLQITDRDGQQAETVSDYNTFESKDGRRLRFSMTQSSGGAVSQRILGEATREADGSGTVRYEQPQAREERLPPGTLFPMMHTIQAIETARAGRRLLLAPLMDGTSEEGAQDSTTVITGWEANPPAQPRFPLLNQPSGQMRIAFFGKKENGGGAGTPDYEIGLRYYANGVADDMKMDFGEFTLNGRLDTLEAIPGGC
ncbi:cell envelope integrity EipB family protein [Roseomonas sp. BN140053]|uniref:cell envelope integrity EipB family protein n=1 Tax=Roseomonas sp. BN140053 TaxID=3391898 RepID=UPI0039EAE8F9